MRAGERPFAGLEFAQAAPVVGYHHLRRFLPLGPVGGDTLVRNLRIFSVMGVDGPFLHSMGMASIIAGVVLLVLAKVWPA